MEEFIWHLERVRRFLTRWTNTLSQYPRGVTRQDPQNDFGVSGDGEDNYATSWPRRHAGQWLRA